MDHFVQIEIQKLVGNSKISRDVVKDFRRRLNQKNLIRSENPTDHFCSFIVPVDIKNNKVFLGHHKKANDWIPPGGHIEKDESPIQTAVREAKEELGTSIEENQLKLFTLDYLDVSAPNKICKIHWHLWYLFSTLETEYVFDRGEFHDAGWFPVSEAPNKIALPQYQKIILSLTNR